MEQPFKNFYKRSQQERLDLLEKLGFLQPEKSSKNLPEDVANHMVENYLFNYELPLGVAVNFSINGEPYVVPMVVEEPSVIAAASNGAKKLNNIMANVSSREIIGQIVFTNVNDVDKKRQIILENKDRLLEIARSFANNMVKRGAGPRDLWVDSKSDEKEAIFLVVYLSMDPAEAMGANAINTVLEGIAPEISSMIDSPILFSILSNYSESSITTAQAKVPILSLHENAMEAEKIANKVEQASRYANLDPYRATTHNKGIMNGIDSVVIATGNDWRAVEAGAHAYASRNGRYQSLTNWEIDKKTNELVGTLSLPLAIGTVGGTIAVHPIAQWSLDLLGNPDAERLAGIIAAVGLAQNYAAVLALVTDGIQKGHMSLHAKSLALQVGAKDDEVSQVIDFLKHQKTISQTTAKEALKEVRKNKG